MGIFQRRSFRIDILTAFGSLLLVTILAVVIYNHRSTSSIVLMLCGDLMRQTTQTVINQAHGFFQHPAALTVFNARLFASGILSLDDRVKLERLALESLISQPQIAMFFIADARGNFVLAKHEDGGGLATKYINRQVQPPLTTWNYWDRSLKVTSSKTTTTDLFEPRRRPWYQGAVATRGLHWTDLYIFYTGQKPGITVSHPILDSRGEVAGVVGCDIELIRLSQFLQSLKLGSRGQIFIMNEKQELVGFSDPVQLLVDPGETGLLQPYRVDSLDHPAVVRSFLAYRRTGQPEVAVEVGGERYRATFTDFPASFGKDWKVGVVVPEDDFIGAVKALTRRVLLIGLFFLGLAVLLTFFIARRISRPILRLAAETDQIRKLKWDQPLELRSRIAEVQILGEAINRMKVSLRSFMRFAPQQLVEEVVLGGRELMLGGDRREVTLLFSDLRNFTQLAEQTRPEDVVQILNVHFDAMVRIIAEHRGYVVDFLGDSLFAVFGAPQPDPDHACQAVKCALTMQLTRARLNQELALPHLPRLEMGIGVNSGSCVVGNMGSQVRIKYGVVGHAVNLAARIETFTVGGQVLISEATRQLVADRVWVSGPFQAYGKGVEGAIQLWEVRGLSQAPEMTLPPTVPDLRPLWRPVPASFRLITGKQIAPEVYEGRIIKLSPAGAVLATDCRLEDFAALHLELAGAAGDPIRLDGKVVGSEAAGYIIRFGPLAEAVREAVAGIMAASGTAAGEG